MAGLLSFKERSPIKISGIGGKISTANRSTLKLSSVTSGVERLLEEFIMPTVITDQPLVPIDTDLIIPGGLPLADPDFRQPGTINLTLGVEVYSRVITGELLELGPNKPLAQGTRLGYVITGYFNKETSSDTEINTILVEGRCDFAGPNAAYKPTKDKNRMNIEPTSHQFKTYKKADFGSTFLNLTKEYLSFVAECPHTIDVPNDQVLRGHNFSPHGNVNFIAKEGNRREVIGLVIH